MKIEQLSIKNFKCFKEKKTFDFPKITILTGANSSGKSSVMYAALGILQSEEFPISFSPNGSFVNMGDFKEISYAHDTKNEIDIDANFHYNANLICIKSTWKENAADFLPQLLSKESICNGIDRVFYPNLYSADFFRYISAFRRMPERTYLEKVKANYKVGVEGEGYLDQIVEWEKRANGKITELLLIMKSLDMIEEIKLKRHSGGSYEILVKPINSKVLTSLANVGFGVSQFLPIIVADLQLPNGSTLFLAEPEIHLHPTIQSKFGDYLMQQIYQKEKKYVIETHSEYFLNKIRLGIVKGILKKEDVKVYFLQNNGEDTAVFDVQFTKKGTIENAPPNFFETYMIDAMDITLNSFSS